MTVKMSMMMISLMMMMILRCLLPRPFGLTVEVCWLALSFMENVKR